MHHIPVGAAAATEAAGQSPRGVLALAREHAEIRRELYLSEPTVKTHVGRILMKLGVRDRVQLVVLAYERGLVEPGRG